MNKATFEQAQASYEASDYARALDLYNTVISDKEFPLQAGEFGLVYHQIGNCYVKLNNYADAITSYVNATTDNSYISLGTVYYNLGMAYAYMSDFGNAINNFKTAIDHPNYRSKFKAYTAMGNALMKSGKSADAASAFRSAAMDNHNPDPTRALLNLGVCFMALNRPEDAVTVYLNTFQYNMEQDFKNRLNANLGQAYVACGQMQKAVEAFEDAIRDKTYQLSDSASVDYQRAIGAVSKGTEEVDPAAVGAAAAAASGMAVENIGSASATEPSSDGAFAEDANSVSANGPVSAFENDQDEQFARWTESAKDAAYNVEKKKHPVRTVIIVLLFVLAGCIIAGSVLFCFGFGFPSQEMICKDYFSNPIAAKDSCFANNLSDEKKASYCAMISQDANAQVLAVTRSVNESYAFVSAKTSEGMDLVYKIKMIRDLVGWKIYSVDLSFSSASE